MVILVVEDGDDLRLLMKLGLESYGYVVETAANGRLALATAAEQRPDIILMDVNMPVMDGLTATRLLRSNPKTREVPIIVISAYDDDAWVERAKAAGCNGCLRKPVDFDVLHQMLGQYE